jgi:hypothetical protein
VVGCTTPYTSYNIAVSRIYRNNHDGTFTEIDAGLQGTYHSAATWADFDADGDLDILLAGQEGEFEGMIGLYRNNWNHVSEPPPVPTGLTAAISTNQALLSWHRDPNNASCSFNLRVGTTPGGTDIVSPQADLVTGWLMIPQNGPAQKCWKLNNLPPGRYYWSVQSVHGAFKASSFAPESQIVIPDAWLAGSRLNGENFEFNLHGVSSQTYTIDISTNLITWSFWRTIQPTNDIGTLSTPAQGGPAFYRIRLNE